MSPLRPRTFAAIATLLFFLAAGTCFSAGRGLWITASVCLLLFVLAAGMLYVAQNRQLTLLSDFIRGKLKGTGAKEKLRMGQAFPTKAHGLEQEIERLLELHRQQAENEAAQQRYYELLLDHVDTGVVSCDTDGHVRWMNRAAEQQIGSLAALPEKWRQMPPGTVRIMSFERHGTPKDLLLSATRFAIGPRPQLLFTLRDIHHVLERQEIASWKALTRVLTHEIMNSISPILSLTETLSTADYARPTPEQSDDLQQALQVIRRRSKGLLDFVENYRKIARLPAPRYTEIHMDGLLDGLKRLFHDPHIVIDQPYPDFTFQADCGQMEQMLINLLKNAREASATPEDEIRIRVRRDMEADEIRISIQDHGKGIPPDVQERIFVPFYTTKPDGSGIGLSLCKQIAFLHHGYITVRSNPGKGSTFTVCLPRTKVREGKRGGNK